jgi:hypothetical protein
MKWIVCSCCQYLIEYSDADVELGGYPHIRCPICNSWIPLF